MANLCQIQNGNMVLDPFVGSGSILITCSLMNCFCLGTDIDYRILKEPSKDKRTKKGSKINPEGTPIHILDNFDDLKLPYPELILSDISLFPRTFQLVQPNEEYQTTSDLNNLEEGGGVGMTCFWREMLDGIICDPPYGIRAGAKRIKHQDLSMVGDEKQENGTKMVDEIAQKDSNEIEELSDNAGVHIPSLEDYPMVFEEK